MRILGSKLRSFYKKYISQVCVIHNSVAKANVAITNNRTNRIYADKYACAYIGLDDCNSNAIALLDAIKSIELIATKALCIQSPLSPISPTSSEKKWLVRRFILDTDNTSIDNNTSIIDKDNKNINPSIPSNRLNDDANGVNSNVLNG